MLVNTSCSFWHSGVSSRKWSRKCSDRSHFAPSGGRLGGCQRRQEQELAEEREQELAEEEREQELAEELEPTEEHCKCGRCFCNSLLRIPRDL